jgi:predicted TIM-barrel fold metal-dependent hydrolase
MIYYAQGEAMTSVADTEIGIACVDADSHLTEPPDLWTSRLPAKWLAEAPRVERKENGEEYWRVGERWLGRVGGQSQAGHTTEGETAWESIDPACYDPVARTKWMDDNGVSVQVLYPNIVALEGHAIMALEDPALKIACIQASNDNMADFFDQAPGRFIGIASVPFWDIDESIKEMERCRNRGHRGVIWAATLAKHGLPPTTDPYWDRFYATAQDLEMSINFHVGVGYTSKQMDIARSGGRTADADPLTKAADATRRTAVGFMSNASTIASVIMDGLCDKFPRLNFVSVESGFGYVPYLMEALDWQWTNPGHHKRFPQRLLPSEYFKRQVYCMFWFEQNTLRLLDLFPDNVMFETDFPHPTSLSPGEGTFSPVPRDKIQQHIRDYGEDLMRKVLFANAARLYNIT